MRLGSDEKLGPTYCEFGRADDRRCGLRYRYGFAAASDSAEWDGPNHSYNGVIRYDMDSGASSFWDYGAGASAGEPVHVPDPGSEREEDGYLMSYVTHPQEGAFLSTSSVPVISSADRWPVCLYPAGCPTVFTPTGCPG